MRGSVQARDVALNYQTRLSLTFAPIVLALFALALADERRKAGRAAVGAWAFSSCVVYWLMLMASGQAVMLGGVSALIVWMPNAVFFLGTVLMNARTCRTEHGTV
jgi:lipopolysaccharide export LptBFGC system permease protein LptF